MAILFHCPYCTASVKVPDSAAGKLGECPKCGTKLRIPTVEVPPTPVAPVAPIPAGPITPIPTMAPPAAYPEPTPQSFDFSKLAGATPPRETAPRPAVTRPRSGGSGKLVGIGITLALVVLLAVGSWLVFRNQPVYIAAATGTHAPSSQGISVSVPWATMNVEASRQPPVIEYFKKHQTSLSNDMVKFEIAASVTGLDIRAVVQDRHELIGVDPAANPDLRKLITSSDVNWDTGRRTVLAQFGKDLCDRVFEAQLKGGKVSGVSDYRDVVVLNALVRGLGRHVLALSSDQRSYPCIFEDKEGKLYFLVPVGTRSFSVMEKSFEGQPRALPDRFRIDVSVEPPAAGLTPIAPPKPDSEAPPEQPAPSEAAPEKAAPEKAAPEKAAPDNAEPAVVSPPDGAK